MTAWQSRTQSSLIVTVVTLGARVVAFLLLPGLTYDGTYYLRQAERLASFEYQLEGFPPGYPFALALLNLIVRLANRVGLA